MNAGRLQILVISDSLAFHGPGWGELTTEPKLWPNVLAAEFERARTPADVTIFGRRGWLSRDGWFALSRDPHVYSVLLPRADVVILALGGMDYLPSVLPSHLREGLRLLPPPFRKPATETLKLAQPIGARLARGRIRSLPQHRTDEYLSLCVNGIRHFHPNTRVLGTTPPSHDAPGYGHVRAGHRPAVRAALAWAERERVELLRIDEWVQPYVGGADMNVDGLHWGWACHREVGEQAAAQLLTVPPTRTTG